MESTHTYISEIATRVDGPARVAGWLYNKRGGGKLWFLQVRDGTGIIQCVVSRRDVDEASFEACGQLTQESALRVEGAVRADARAPGGYELQATRVEIVSIAGEFPITPKEHGTAFLMDHRHLWLRSRLQHAILRVRARLVQACRHYFDSRGFVLIDAPIFTPASCEGTTTLFETSYFDDKAYLTQSGQLYIEAGAMAFGKVYCCGPTFRAERSKTRRHLTEFWMIEPEVAYFDLEDNMNLAEDFIVTVVAEVLESCREEFKTLERDTAPLEAVRKPFPRLHYREAVQLLREKGATFEEGNDFGGPDETMLSEHFDRPIMVHHFPSAIKAFYMKRDAAEPQYALGCDVLAPEGYGEIIGGGQREDDLRLLEQRLQEHGLSREPFEWYLDLRRYGSVPHAGFGMGIERAVSWLCKLTHVRETIPFPRMMYRLTP